MLEVYKVESKETGEQVFAGIWEDADVCWKSQLELLENDTHPIKKLQDHFNEFGKSDFVMTKVKVNSVEEAEAELRKMVPSPLPEEHEPIFPDDEVEMVVVPEPNAEKAVVKKPGRKAKK